MMNNLLRRKNLKIMDNLYTYFKLQTKKDDSIESIMFVDSDDLNNTQHCTAVVYSRT